MFEGFTRKQAEYGVKQAGLWPLRTSAPARKKACPAGFSTAGGSALPEGTRGQAPWGWPCLNSTWCGADPCRRCSYLLWEPIRVPIATEAIRRARSPAKIMAPPVAMNGMRPSSWERSGRYDWRAGSYSMFIQ